MEIEEEITTADVAVAPPPMCFAATRSNTFSDERRLLGSRIKMKANSRIAGARKGFYVSWERERSGSKLIYFPLSTLPDMETRVVGRR